MPSPSNHTIYRNRVLASMPVALRTKIEPHLSPMTFKRNQTLCEAGQMVENVYFLEDGICSIVVTMKDGNTVEVGIIGRDSFVGVPAVFGSGHSLHRAFIQLPGRGFSIKAKILQQLLSDSAGQLRLCLQGGVEAYFAQTAQTAACNRVHELEERLARWLLMCHDRMEVDRLPITHEFLAVMLGTRRPTVTLAAGTFQKAGLVECSRGYVEIKDRKGLEDVACECYAIIHAEYVRLGLLEKR